MITLGEQLTKYIKRNHTNARHLCMETGLDRTTLQKMIKGNRLCGTEYLEKLCEALKLTGEEREEIRGLYEIEKMGRSVYESNMVMEEMFHDILWENVLSESMPFEISENEDAQSEYWMNLSEKTGALFEYVICHNQIEKKTCCHIMIKFYKSTEIMENRICNLQKISILFRFLMRYRGSCKIYDTYVNSNGRDESNRLWSDFFITGDEVILFAEEMRPGIRMREEDVVKAYRCELDRLLKNYELLPCTMTWGKMDEDYMSLKSTDIISSEKYVSANGMQFEMMQQKQDKLYRITDVECPQNRLYICRKTDNSICLHLENLGKKNSVTAEIKQQEICQNVITYLETLHLKSDK